MKQVDVDVAILGAGTAGLVARRSAEKSGARTIMIDPGPLGTTCARIGCMPSKLLIAAAEAAHHAQHAEIFGVNVSVEIDGKKVMQRVKSERDRFVGFVLDSVEKTRARGNFIQSRGEFVDEHTIKTEDGTLVKFKSAVIATGSSPFVPPPYRKLSKKVLQFNDDVFEWNDLPESVLVVGTGVIALELGQALDRLGVRTTIVGIDGLIGPLSDPKMLRAAHNVFEPKLDIHTDYTLDLIEETDNGVHIEFTDPDGSTHKGDYQYVLMAAGRRPNIDKIGLENLDLMKDERGKLVWDSYTTQIGMSHIFLAGDANNFRPLLHEAADEGHIAGKNAASYPDVFNKHRTTSIGIVFTEPQIALVGQSWREMNCEENRVGTVDYGKQGRARVMNLNEGLVRIYGEAHTGMLLGAEMLGPRVEHTAHLLAWAIEQKLTVSEVLAMPFYHPVFEEGIRTALRNLESNLKMARKPGDSCEEFGPGA